MSELCREHIADALKLLSKIALPLRWLSIRSGVAYIAALKELVERPFLIHSQGEQTRRGGQMRRANLALTWAVLTSLFLASCGGNDGQEREAFTTFLQTRVLDKPGVHVPQLTDDERGQFGSYADQYAIITDFNKAMDQSVSPKLNAAMRAGSISSMGDLMSRLPQLREAKAGINVMDAALAENVMRADAARAKLDQSPDLQPVYDKTFDRLVTQPAAAFKSIVPVMNKVLDEAIDLGSYLEVHRASIRISGPLVETGDPAVQAGINERVKKLQANQQAVQAAQERLRSVVYGR